MSRIGSVFALVLAGTAVAQVPTRLEQIGAVARSQPDFYGAIAGPGETVRVEWKLSASAAELGESVRLTLTVRNAVNPQELTRPDLGKRADFAALFSLIEPVPDPQPAADATAVEFVYSLRPRNVGTQTVPSVKYAFYHPRFPKGREMQARYLEELTLAVTKPVVTVAPPVPLTGPESFFAPASGSYASAGTVPGTYWLSLLCGAPAVLVCWVVLWRWLFPDATRLARLRRNRAVRRTLDRLRAANRAADPAGATATAIRDYLSARFGLSPVAATPAEVSEGLTELTVPPERVSEADELLRRCDADRFAPEPTRTAIAADAIRLVERWEGVTK